MSRVPSDSLGPWLCIDGIPASLLSSRRMYYPIAATAVVIGTAVKRAAKFPSAALKPRHHVACGVRRSADIGSLLTSIYLASTRRVGPHVEGHATQRDRLLLRGQVRIRLSSSAAPIAIPRWWVSRSEYGASLMNYQN